MSSKKDPVYFNYYCPDCAVYTKTSKKRHQEIVHYKGSFEEEPDYREPADKRKLKSSEKTKKKDSFTIDKSSSTSNLNDRSESKSQPESPQKRQKVLCKSCLSYLRELLFNSFLEIRAFRF
jgi:Pyruvate/2-oxoacid:ferredoxin oxidoreductase delta subunit